jgi:hypothetical protein
MMKGRRGVVLERRRIGVKASGQGSIQRKNSFGARSNAARSSLRLPEPALTAQDVTKNQELSGQIESKARACTITLFLAQ